MKMLNLGCGSRIHPDWINMDINPAEPGVIPCNFFTPLPFADNVFNAVYHSHLLEHFPKHFAPVFLGECFRVLKDGGIIRVAVPDMEQIARLYLDFLDKADSGDKEAARRYEWIMLEMFDQMVRNHTGGEMLAYWRQNPMPAENFVIERMGSEVLRVLEQMRNSSPLPPNPEPASYNDRPIMPGAMETGEFRLSGEVHQWMYDRYSLKILLHQAGFQNIHTCRADESNIPDFNTYLLDIEKDGKTRKPDSLFMEGRKVKKLNT